MTIESPQRTLFAKPHRPAGLLIVLLLLSVTGCDRPVPVKPVRARTPGVSQSFEDKSPVDSLAKIRVAISAGDWNEAQKAVQTRLLRSPGDREAMLLVAKIFLARGQVGDAIDSLEALHREYPDFDVAHHELVSLLNQRGFRFDANEHVRQLCRRGKSRPEELRGLMFPTRSFTGLTERPSVDDAAVIRRYGALNVALAMYSEGDVKDASQVLGTSLLVLEKHPAAVALYGQTLIESQQFGKFQDWLSDVGTEPKRYPAYWMALGGYAMRERKFDIAVRQFAEAVLREPGDLAANDRMTQALAAGGHREAHERFRRRGVLIDRLMTLTRQVFVQARLEPREVVEISQLLTDAGRPLPALAWYRIALQAMGSNASAMRKLDEALAMVDEDDFQSSNRVALLCGVDLNQFPDDFNLVTSQPTRIRAKISLPARNHLPPLDPVFVNVAPEVGLDFTYCNAPTQVKRELRLFQQFGAGVACFDFDLDGNVDFYVGQASGEPPKGRGTRPNLLARSLGDRFINVTALAGCDDRGYTCGITSGDWNQDGFPDLVVGNLAQNTLFLNRGDGTFIAHHVSGSVDSLWADPLNTTSLAIADINGDHLPDLVEVNYVDDPSVYQPIDYKADGTPVQLPFPLDFRPSEDRLFLSQGDGTLVGQLLDDRQSVSPATGLGIIVTDINGDLGNEIFIANDRLANHLWERQIDSDDGRLELQDTAAVRGLAFGAKGTPMGCMGIAASDFDGNGRLDLHVTNFENEWNNQFMQDRSGFFDDLVVSYGFDQTTYKMLGFGVQALDYDNNMTMDLVIGNGHVEDYTDQGRSFEMPTILFTMQDSQFVPIPVRGDPSYWGTGHLSRALATCDWNNDGRVDFVVTDLTQPFALLENRTETLYRWLQLRLVGTTAERDAIGATLQATIGGQTITKVVQSGDGYMCKNQSLISFALGDNQSVERLGIQWPDGQKQTLIDLSGNRSWLVVQGQTKPFELDR